MPNTSTGFNSTDLPTYEPERSFTAETALLVLCNFVISYACGCATRKSDYIRAMRHPTPPIICTVGQFILRPSVAYLLCRVLEVENKLAIGILLCCVAPGGNGSNLMELLFDGDIELGIICTTISSLIAACAIPVDVICFIQRLEDEDFEMPWGEIFYTLGACVLGALSGSITRHKWDALARTLETICAFLGILILVSITTATIVTKWKVMAYTDWRAWLVGALLGPMGSALGWTPATILRLSQKEVRTITVEVGEVNIGVAYAMMLLVWPEGETRDRVFSGIVIYTVFNQVFVWLIVIVWSRDVIRLFFHQMKRKNVVEPSVSSPALAPTSMAIAATPGYSWSTSAR